MEFSFQGSKVELHGLMDTEGANMMVQLDSVISDINTSTGAGGASLQHMVMFSKDNLNPDVVHTLSVGWVGNGAVSTQGPSIFMYFDHLVVWNYRVAATSSTSNNGTNLTPSQTSFSATSGYGQSVSSATSSALPIGTSSAKSSASPGLFIGITLGCIVLLVAFVYGSVRFLRYRRRLRAPSARFRLWVTTHMESRVDGPPSPPLSMLMAKPHMSLPPAYRRNSKALEKKREEEERKYREGISYLDLESGTPDETGGLGNTTQKCRSGARLSVNVSIPQQPHFKEPEQSSPYTPFTPYTMRVGQVVRPQYSQAILVAPSSIPSEEGNQQQVFSSASEEKKHIAEARKAENHSRETARAASSGTHTPADGIPPLPLPLPRGMYRVLPPEGTGLDSQFGGSPNSLSVIANTSPRTISAPPPYGL